MKWYLRSVDGMHVHELILFDYLSCLFPPVCVSMCVCVYFFRKLPNAGLGGERPKAKSRDWTLLLDGQYNNMPSRKRVKSRPRGRAPPTLLVAVVLAVTAE